VLPLPGRGHLTGQAPGRALGVADRVVPHDVASLPDSPCPPPVPAMRDRDKVTPGYENRCFGADGDMAGNAENRQLLPEHGQVTGSACRDSPARSVTAERGWGRPRL
jgi:hypothetical protein